MKGIENALIAGTIILMTLLLLTAIALTVVTVGHIASWGAGNG